MRRLWVLCALLLLVGATVSSQTSRWPQTTTAAERVTRSYTFVARSGASGTYYSAGFYLAPATDANLTQAVTTVTVGGANTPSAAHAFIVAGGNGTTDGSDLVLTVSGTSVNDAGVRTGSDTEVIEATAEVSAADTHFETDLKWIGEVTFTLSSTGGTAFSYDFNYGLAKYEDFGNRAFRVVNFESVGLANANDAGFDVQLGLHTSTGWTYSAAAFAASPTVIVGMNTVYSTEQDIDSGEMFAFERSGLSQVVNGAGSEGIIIQVDTGVNNSVSYMDSHVEVVLQ